MSKPYQAYPTTSFKAQVTFKDSQGNSHTCIKEFEANGDDWQSHDEGEQAFELNATCFSNLLEISVHQLKNKNAEGQWVFDGWDFLSEVEYELVDS